MLNRKARILALDFDGVICNSKVEVLAIALETYITMCPESSLKGRIETDRNLFLQAFENLVPLGNRAEDFGVALSASDQQVTITNQLEYDRFFAKTPRDWREAYHHEFYRTREKMRSTNLNSWLGLHKPYLEVIRFLEELEGITLAIVTAKDEPSVRLLLSSFHINHLFRDDLILDKSVGIEKTTHLIILKNRLKADFAEIIFIDDKVRHLKTVKDLGVDPVLATWGYNTQRECDLARDLGFRLARLDDLSTIFS